MISMCLSSLVGRSVSHHHHHHHHHHLIIREDCGRDATSAKIHNECLFKSLLRNEEVIEICFLESHFSTNPWGPNSVHRDESSSQQTGEVTRDEKGSEEKTLFPHLNFSLHYFQCFDGCFFFSCEMETKHGFLPPRIISWCSHTHTHTHTRTHTHTHI